jgi:hypothetical protein
MSYFSASIYTNKNGVYSEIIPSASRPTELEAIEHAIISYVGKDIRILRISGVVAEICHGKSYAKDVTYCIYNQLYANYTVRVFIHDFSGQLTIDPNQLKIARDAIKSLL